MGVSPEWVRPHPRLYLPERSWGRQGQKWGPWYSCGGESGKPLGMGTEVKVEGSRLSESCRVALDTARRQPTYKAMGLPRYMV